MNLGKRAEDVVAARLERCGYKIVSRNYRTKIGEIDIIAEKDEVLYLVEVRSVGSSLFVSPAESITPVKLSRIARSGEIYVQKEGLQDIQVNVLVAEVYWYNSGRTKVSLVPVE